MAWSYHPDWRIGLYYWLGLIVYCCAKDCLEMRQKECPSCAMEIDSKSKECPICGYEFGEVSIGYRWIAIVLIIVFLLYLFVL